MAGAGIGAGFYPPLMYFSSLGRFGAGRSPCRDPAWAGARPQRAVLGYSCSASSHCPSEHPHKKLGFFGTSDKYHGNLKDGFSPKDLCSVTFSC